MLTIEAIKAEESYADSVRQGLSARCISGRREFSDFMKKRLEDFVEEYESNPPNTA